MDYFNLTKNQNTWIFMFWRNSVQSQQNVVWAQAFGPGTWRNSVARTNFDEFCKESGYLFITLNTALCHMTTKPWPNLSWFYFWLTFDQMFCCQASFLVSYFFWFPRFLFQSLHPVCHMTHVICQVSQVICQHVRCHLSGVTCQVSHGNPNSQTRELELWEKVHIFPPVTCHVSCVMCHLSHIAYFFRFF